MKIQDGEDFRDATPEEEALLTQVQVAPIPQVISRRQGIQQLIDEDLIDLVQPLIDKIKPPKEQRMAQAAWDEATEFHRTDPLMILIATGLGKDAAALDQMFVNAAKR